MKQPSPLPANSAPIFPALDPSSFSRKEGEDLFSVMRHLIDGDHPGVFTTVDSEGRPCARWMASLCFDELPWIYTITAVESKKVGQIEANPNVSWMFSNADLSLILNMSGVAIVHRDTATTKRIWAKVRHKEKAYFLRGNSVGQRIAVVATKLETIECCTPQSLRKFSIAVEQMVQLY